MVIGPEELRVLNAAIMLAHATDLWNEARYEQNPGLPVRDTLKAMKTNNAVMALHLAVGQAEEELLEAVQALDEWKAKTEYPEAEGEPAPVAQPS